MKIHNYLLTLALSVLAMIANLAPSAALVLEYETEIVSMDLSGTFPLPLGDEWTNVLSEFRLNESLVFNSKGHASATYIGGGSDPTTPSEIQDGDLFIVDSFFDVFFDIEIEDVDPGARFGGGLPSLMFFPHSGDLSEAAHMNLGVTRPADTSKPNFGLFPIDGDVYIGTTEVEISLPLSLGGNPVENDNLKFQFSAFNVVDVSAAFLVLPDGTVVQEFDYSAPLNGSIDDASQDPPFGPFNLVGPTIVHSLLSSIPEPSTLALAASVHLGLLGWRRRNRV